VRDGLRERRDAVDGRSARQRGLARVLGGRDHAGELGDGRRGSDRQCPAHRMDPAVETELADDAPAGEVGQARLALGGEQPGGDREVERDAFLAYAGRRQVHGDAALGVLEARVAQRRADAVARLAHGTVGKADRRRLRQARRYVHLDVDDERVDSAERARADTGQHRPSVPRASGRRND
jgi:hypothetical protein